MTARSARFLAPNERAVVIAACSMVVGALTGYPSGALSQSEDAVTWMRGRQEALGAAFAAGVDARPIVADMLDTSGVAAAAFDAVWADIGEAERAEIERDLARVMENRYCELSRAMSATYDDVVENGITNGGDAASVSVRYLDEVTGPTLIHHSLRLVDGRWRVDDVRAFDFSLAQSVAQQFREHIRDEGPDAIRSYLSRLSEHDFWPPGIPDSCAPPP